MATPGLVVTCIRLQLSLASKYTAIVRWTLKILVGRRRIKRVLLCFPVLVPHKIGMPVDPFDVMENLASIQLVTMGVVLDSG